MSKTNHLLISLSNDLVHFILKHVTCKDRAKLRSVCKYLHNIIPKCQITSLNKKHKGSLGATFACSVHNYPSLYHVNTLEVLTKAQFDQNIVQLCFNSDNSANLAVSYLFLYDYKTIHNNNNNKNSKMLEVTKKNNCSCHGRPQVTFSSAYLQHEYNHGSFNRIINRFSDMNHIRPETSHTLTQRDNYVIISVNTRNIPRETLNSLTPGDSVNVTLDNNRNLLQITHN